MNVRIRWVGFSLAWAVAASAMAAPQPLSRFARPAATPAAEAQLVREEDQALATARAAVADMRKLAHTPAETRLAQADGVTVETIAGLVRKRRQIREKEEALIAPKSTVGAGMTARGASSGAGGAGVGRGNPIGAAAGGDSQAQLLQATQQMQETEMSFNLQYLQLQSQMQAENRSYTAVSGIMKVKHDTVKNSINNVR
jgi:hypothetical protein